MTAAAHIDLFIYPDDIDSATSEPECRRLWELAHGRVCLELGAWKGRTTVTLAQSARTVHAVDHFCGDEQTGYGSTLGEYLQNLSRYGVNRKVITHIGSFDRMLPVLKPATFDLVFCDGLHTLEATEQQAQWADTLAKPGAVLAFHDYGLTHEGFHVTEVVDGLGYPVEVVDTLAVIQL